MTEPVDRDEGMTRDPKAEGAAFNAWWQNGAAMRISDGSWRGIAFDGFLAGAAYERTRIRTELQAARERIAELEKGS